MKKKATKKTMSQTQKVGIGVGITAATVAAAGAYFLYGSKKAGSNRKKVKGWAMKAKGEVLEALEKAQTITEDEYTALVAAATGAYGTLKNASAGEVRDFKKEMHHHWGQIQKSGAMKKIASVKKKATKKVVAKKPAAKKVVKKSVTKKAPVKKAATKKSAPKKAVKKGVKKK